MRRALALLLLVACAYQDPAPVTTRTTTTTVPDPTKLDIGYYDVQSIQIRTQSGRTVDCVVYRDTAISCDWGER